MLKRLITFCFAVIIFVTASPITLAHEYKDIPQESPFYYAVHYLRRNDVFKDTEYFNPDTLITRAEYIKYLVLLNSPEFKTRPSAELPFEDTRNNAWYASYFKEAIKLGILDDRQRKAEPEKKLTMIDGLTLLFHSQSIPIPNVYKGTIPYTDVKRNTQAAALIMRALSLDIIYPQRNDYVGIYQRVTRAQAARMIYKMDLVTLGTPYSNGLPQINTHTLELEKIISVWELIESTYLHLNEVDKQLMADELLKTLVDQLEDPYSAYMDEEENRAFEDSLDGEIEGIGAVIGFNENEEITIISPIKDGPADRAGMMPKDVIISVDDEDVTGYSLEEIVSIIKGPKGTTVKVTVRRQSGTKIFTIKRELIEIPSVEYELMDGGNVMLVEMAQFNNNASFEFNLAVEALKSQGARGIILDLRGNPGGLLDQCLAILGHFVEAQEDLVTINYSDYTQVLLSRGPADLSNIPTVVLIDQGSASASEIVAGALQDYNLATIIGETSFGKGTVQEVSYFVDSSSLKLTVAEWLTPNRNVIQENGIVPDLTAVDDPDTEADEALDRALQELSKKF